MKTPRRRFLKRAAIAGTAAAFPGLLTSCVSSSGDSPRGDSATAAASNPSARLGPPRTTELFDNGWRFHLGDVPGASENAFDESSWTDVQLPHDWSIEQAFDSKYASATGYLPGGIGWYRKSFRLPEQKDRRVRVLFEGVYNHSEVWINGQRLGARPYGYISFDYELTPHLFTDDRPNILAVKVDHSEFADTRWYNGSGIYRHVWLVSHHDVHIPTWGTFVTTTDVSQDFAFVEIATRVSNAGGQAQEVVLESTIEGESNRRVPGGELSQTLNPGGEFRFQQRVSLPHPRLWSPDTPHLYELVSRVKIGGAVVDECRTPFGVRSAQFDANQGFVLNGHRTMLKGVCLHHDAGGLGAAVPAGVWERRLRLLKECGCNAIRTSHNPPAPEFLDLCDRMGFLVMDEAFDEWARPKKKWLEGVNVRQPGFEGYAKHFKEWGITDLKAMVERDKNHPSIILWSIGNEIDYPGDPYFDPSMRDYSPDKPNVTELPGIAANLVAAVKEIDTTRPVTAALANIAASNKTGLPDLLDVTGYNYQEADYTRDHAKYPARKMLGTENKPSYAAWKSLLDQPWAGGQFLWTGIDYLGESPGWPARGGDFGLLDVCGFPKPQFYFRQSLWSDKPMIALAAHLPVPVPTGGRPQRREPSPEMRWNWPVDAGSMVNVVCYTNCATAELFLNGKSLGEKTRAEMTDGVLNWPVPYSAGTLRVTGRNRGSVVCAHELKTAGEPKRIVLAPDKSTVTADGRSVVHLVASVVDEAGTVVFGADKSIGFEISGPARLLVVDSGDQRSHESFRTGARKVYRGRCLAILQTILKPGVIKVTASGPGLLATQISIKAEAG